MPFLLQRSASQHLYILYIYTCIYIFFFSRTPQFDIGSWDTHLFTGHLWEPHLIRQVLSVRLALHKGDIRIPLICTLFRAWVRLVKGSIWVPPQLGGPPGWYLGPHVEKQRLSVFYIVEKEPDKRLWMVTISKATGRKKTKKQKTLRKTCAKFWLRRKTDASDHSYSLFMFCSLSHHGLREMN